MPKAAAAKPSPARKLKVYRTAAGFYDAYVAATSQKAAIEAWGADKNLFSRGGGEIVSDPDLTAEPLANPGVVIKRKRGSLSEQLAALAAAKPATRRRPTAAAEPVKDAAPAGKNRPRTSKPKPRPSRASVETAEDELRRFDRQATEALDEIRAKEAALAQERQALERAHAAARTRLARAADAARARYDVAMEKWRAALD